MPVRFYNIMVVATVLYGSEYCVSTLKDLWVMQIADSKFIPVVQGYKGWI